MSDPPPTRRRIIQAGAAVAAASASGALGLQLWMRSGRGPAWGQRLPFLTPQDQFYNRYDAKKFDPRYWLQVRAIDASGAAQPAYDKQLLDGDSRIAHGWINVV